jgi:hypothetical protein
LTAGDATVDQVIEIFGLKFTGERWEQREETYDAPRSLSILTRPFHFKSGITNLLQAYNLNQLKKALYDTSSEAYNRIAIDYLIVACMVKHRDILSKQYKLPDNDPTAATTPTVEQSELSTNSPHDQQATEITVPSYIAPTTPLMAPKSTFQPLPIKVFPEMSLSVQVEKGGQEWLVSGIADWAMGYGDRAVLGDGTVLLAIEAKRKENVSNAEAQLLAYLATIRQLRIQANKKNVMTQGFFSDGEVYRFMCIRNNGTVMKSAYYDLSLNRDLKSVFNFLLSILITAAESSPNTSPTKPGPEQDKEIGNFDRDIFVKVFEDVDVDYNIPIPTIYHDEEMEEADEWSDIELPEEE